MTAHTREREPRRHVALNANHVRTEAGIERGRIGRGRAVRIDNLDVFVRHLN